MKRALIGVAAVVLVAAPAAFAASPTIDARIAPASPRFGDTFAYVVTASVDASRLATARVVAEVAPFTRMGAAVESRSSTNGVGHITVTESLACLAAACLGRSIGAAVALPRARVSAGGQVATTPRVEVAVGSRVGATAVKATEPAFRRPEGLPSSTFRVSPTAATLLLGLLGLVLLALGAIVLSAPLRRVRGENRQAVDVDQRKRAARLLRASAARDSADRRRAASLASRVVGEPGLARAAAGVAWSRSEPGPPDATTLADRVEHAPSGTA